MQDHEGATRSLASAFTVTSPTTPHLWNQGQKEEVVQIVADYLVSDTTNTNLYLPSV